MLSEANGAWIEESHDTDDVSARWIRVHPLARQLAAEAERRTNEALPAFVPYRLVLEPARKTWVVIRTGPGGQPLYEDFLYPTARAMHLPAGKYFIELRDADAVEISKDGKTIAYSAPGVLVD